MLTAGRVQSDRAPFSYMPFPLRKDKISEHQVTFIIYDRRHFHISQTASRKQQPRMVSCKQTVIRRCPGKSGADNDAAYRRDQQIRAVGFRHAARRMPLPHISRHSVLTRQNSLQTSFRHLHQSLWRKEKPAVGILPASRARRISGRRRPLVSPHASVESSKAGHL